MRYLISFLTKMFHAKHIYLTWNTQTETYEMLTTLSDIYFFLYKTLMISLSLSEKNIQYLLTM